MAGKWNHTALLVIDMQVLSFSLSKKYLKFEFVCLIVVFSRFGLERFYTREWSDASERWQSHSSQCNQGGPSRQGPWNSCSLGTVFALLCCFHSFSVCLICCCLRRNSIFFLGKNMRV